MASARMSRWSGSRRSLQQTAEADPERVARLGKRQAERAVSWTAAERLRWLWYRAHLTVRDMNDATGRLYGLQTGPLPGAQPGRDRG